MIAASAIYLYKNSQCNPDEIDLHGLYIDEAVQAVQQRIENCIRRGDNHLHMYVLRLIKINSFLV